MIKRMRTIKGALKEIKEEDPASAITEYWLRKAIKTQKIPSIKAGSKYLIVFAAAFKNSFTLKFITASSPQFKIVCGLNVCL